MQPKNKAIAFTLIFAAAVLIFLYWLSSTGTDPRNEIFIPENALAYLEINRFPSSLEHLKDTRFMQFFELSRDDTTESERFQEISELYLLLHTRVEKAWVCVHGLQKKENGAIRISFSAWIYPGKGQKSVIQAAIRKSIQEKFEISATEPGRSSEIEILEGNEPGQVLYCQELPSTLYYSNSPEAWKEFSRKDVQPVKNLESSLDYQSILRQLPRDPDVLFYFRGVDFFPEFGYAIKMQGQVLTDFYVESTDN
jgi:hypothetical protein